MQRFLASCAVFMVMTAAASSNDDVHEIFAFEHVSCTGGDYEIRIAIKGVKRAVGLITADLYPNNQEVFLRGKGRVKKVKFAAKKPMTQFCMRVPEPGKYALAVYHDKNANGSFDKNAFGLPAEPWGISQNPKVRFAPPTVDEAIFEVAENGAEVEIELN